MPEPPIDHAAARPKPARSASLAVAQLGQVRPRPPSPSPPPGSSAADAASGTDRPPAKRARKAINCEPCRNSKLKCDRSRPCSSCVLRGTSSLCYQDHRGVDAGEVQVRGQSASRLDPVQEFARVRRSLALLETYVLKNGAATSGTPGPPADYYRASSLTPDESPPKKEFIELDVENKTSAPGSLGRQSAGLYTGSTSTATHLISSDPREDDSDRQSNDDDLRFEYDRDLLARLPPLPVIDSLIDFYFDYANWIYRHINQVSFTKQWNKYKTGHSTDRITLATACCLMAVSTYYLPEKHTLKASLVQPDVDQEAGEQYHDVMREALARYQAESNKYSLELVELQLLRCHYMTLSKKYAEEIWAVKGELITVATAMGLHRDPGKWKLARDVAERRRWAWWHIILLERWQAFLFGRPLAIASHHFDTQLPTYCDPSIDATGRLYLPNIALFRLAYILGDVMDDAVSLRPVSYDSVLARDKALTQWMDALPRELDMDDFRVARSLASPVSDVRRLGVQSIIVRIAYYHIRFTLHRPYATKSTSPSAVERSPEEAKQLARSLETAVNAADKVISLVLQARPDFLSNTSLAVPGHMNWGSFHIFSAAMFFSFQLIANPDQPGANLFRANIAKSMEALRALHGGVAVADKAYNILQAIAPLYSEEFKGTASEDREAKKSSVLSRVKTLAFPYHDSSYPRSNLSGNGTSGSVGSPSARNLNSPAVSQSHSPGTGSTIHGLSGSPVDRKNGMMAGQHMNGGMLMSHHGTPVNGSGEVMYATPGSSGSIPMTSMQAMQSYNAAQQAYGNAGGMVGVGPLGAYGARAPQHAPQYAASPAGQPIGYTQPLSTSQHPPTPGPSPGAAAMLAQEANAYGETLRPAYPIVPVTPATPSIGAMAPGQAEGVMWGAQMGFEQGEWVQFLDAMQRPDTSRGM